MSRTSARILSAILALTLAGRASAIAQEFGVDWVAPERIEAGAIGSNRIEVRSTIWSRGVTTELGVQAWSLAVVADGGDVVAATIDGTAGAEEPDGLRRGGFELTELTSGAGNEGAVSAVVLSFSDGVSLPKDDSAEVLRVDVEAPSPDTGCSVLTMRYAESLTGRGEPITTRVVYRGIGVVPQQAEASIEICQLPKIAVSPIAVDFGQVLVGSVARRTVEVRNSGTDTLEIADLLIPLFTSDPDFSLEPLTLPAGVAPGDAIDVEIIYEPLLAGSHSAEVRVRSNATNSSEVVVAVRGTAIPVPVPYASASPQAIAFGDVVIGRFATRTLTLANEGDAALEISAIELDAAGSDRYQIDDAGVPIVLAPRATTRVVIRLTPLDEDPVSSALIVSSNDPDAPKLLVPISGRGTIAPLPGIHTDPDAELDFGGVVIGRSFTRIVTVTNSGDAPLEISSIALEGSEQDGFFLRAPSTARIFSGVGSLAIEVTYQPFKAGSNAATLAIRSDDPSRPRVEIALIGRTSDRPITPFRRGDPNGDTESDISDGIMIFAYLFLGGRPPTCFDAGDANDDGRIDIGDGIFILNFLFLDGPVTPEPGLERCGFDPTPDALIACSQTLCR